VSSPKQHKPRKRFGQNFLHDQSVLERITTAISPQIDDHIVEIGPGLGALTRYLLESVDSINAVEIDRDLASHLSQVYGDKKLKLVNEDALKYDFTSLYDGEHPLRVVGNLPYNISTPLIFHLLKSAHLIKDMHFMLQLEVVERLAAEPGSKIYGRLSVMAQYYSKVEKLFTVPPGAFNPPPKVYSAVVRLTPRQQLVEVGSPEHFEKLVMQAFSQRRKTLRNTLKKIVSPQAFEKADIDSGRRCETLNLDEFARLSLFSYQETDNG
jgi:16S rRNA (adenine1518-N6/adenine1519-N6)-dimethyltransferase